MTEDVDVQRPRRILGIDPGLRVTGFGVLELHGTALVYITSGCIRATGTSLPIRLGVIARDLAHLIAELAPAEVAVENSVNDTDDTKPSSGDTPTIQPVPTMSVAGVTDVDFVEATDCFVPSTRARSGSK